MTLPSLALLLSLVATEGTSSQTSPRVMLTFEPKFGQMMVHRRSIEFELIPEGGNRISFNVGERAVEIPTDFRNDGFRRRLVLRVVRTRVAPAIEAGESIPMDPGVYAVHFNLPLDDEVTVERNGHRSPSEGTLPRSFPGFSSDDLFLLPSVSVQRGDEWSSPRSEEGLTLRHRFEGPITVGDEQIALISIRPQDVETTAWTPETGEIKGELAGYSVWAVRVTDGVILRSTLTIGMRGRGYGQIRYESALEGAPTWAQMSAVRWAARHDSLRARREG